MDDILNALYHELILEHNAAPRFFEKRPAAQYVVEAFNPLCGDKFRLYLDVAEGRIQQATFHGYGCAVSKASASVLMEQIQGLEMAAVREVTEKFLVAMGPRSHLPLNAPDIAPATAAFLPARDFPGRLQCATLAWSTLEEFLEKKAE